MAATVNWGREVALRRKLPWLIALVGAMAVALAPSASADWSQPVAASLNVDTSQNAFVTGLASIGGTPYVTWNESNGTSQQIRVKQLAGGAWVSVGASLNFNTSEDGRGSTLASVGGVPYAAWYESNGMNDEIRVASFQGGTWSAVGASPNVAANEDAESPSIASVGGVPYVAWYESDGHHDQIRVKDFNGSAWVADPSLNASGSLNIDTSEDAKYPKLASVGGVPYVVWQESNGSNDEIRAASLSGGTWEAVGGPLNVDASDEAADPTIASIGGTPYVAWDESNGTTQQIRVAKFVGGSWVAVGGSLNIDSMESAFSPSVASVGGVPFVAWQESNGTADQIRVAHFDGSAWVPVSGSLNVDASKDATSPTIVSVGGVPYVTWYSRDSSSGQEQVRVKRLEPDFLSERATPSRTGAVLSAQINDFGVPLPVGFEYGRTASFGSAAPVETSSGAGDSTIAEAIGGLAPGTTYDWRAFGTDGVRETSQGQTESFTTLEASNAFSFGKLKLNKKKGSAKLKVLLPGPGLVVLSGRGVKHLSKRVGAGVTTLTISARGRLKRKLDQLGKVKLKLSVKFAPTGGTPATKHRSLVLRAAGAP